MPTFPRRRKPGAATKAKHGQPSRFSRFKSIGRRKIDAEGNVIAGSLEDAIEARDIWTFSRNVEADGPDWLLDETDEA